MKSGILCYCVCYINVSSPDFLFHLILHINKEVDNKLCMLFLSFLSYLSTFRDIICTKIPS